jgi:hypothetical protein
MERLPRKLPARGRAPTETVIPQGRRKFDGRTPQAEFLARIKPQCRAGRVDH